MVTATCVRAGDMILDGQCLHLCVIDEATHVSCNSITPLKAQPSNSHFPTSYRGVFPTALKHPRLNPSLLKWVKKEAATPMPGFRNACLAHSHL